MNYIEDELRRQQVLLSRLLLGVPAEAGAEEEASSQQRPDSFVRALPAAGPAAPDAGEALAYGYEAPRWAAAASARAMESLGTPSLSAAHSYRGTAAAGHGSNLRESISGSGVGPVGSVGYFSAGGDAPIGQGVVLLTAAGRDTPSGEQNAARTVSLWAERDARRYDGGYTMY